MSANTINVIKTPVLHEAIRAGSPDTVKLLLAYGADPNKPDDDGDTPLHRIAKRLNFLGREELLESAELLAAAGANSNIANKNGKIAKDLIEPVKFVECGAVEEITVAFNRVTESPRITIINELHQAKVAVPSLVRLATAAVEKSKNALITRNTTLFNQGKSLVPNDLVNKIDDSKNPPYRYAYTEQETQSSSSVASVPHALALSEEDKQKNSALSSRKIREIKR